MCLGCGVCVGQYEYAHLSPGPTGRPCFLVREQCRRSPTQVQVLALFYIDGDGVVQAMPSLHSVMAAHLLAAIDHVSTAVQELTQVTQFNRQEARFEFRGQAPAPPITVVDMQQEFNTAAPNEANVQLAHRLCAVRSANRDAITRASVVVCVWVCE